MLFRSFFGTFSLISYFQTNLKELIRELAGDEKKRKKKKVFGYKIWWCTARKRSPKLKTHTLPLPLKKKTQLQVKQIKKVATQLINNSVQVHPLWIRKICTRRRHQPPTLSIPFIRYFSYSLSKTLSQIIRVFFFSKWT